MPPCRHCSRDISYNAKFCPNCGEPDSPEVVSGPNYEDAFAKWFGGGGAIIGATIGFIGGLVNGFHDHGVGGALLYAAFFAVFGGILGVFVLMLAGYALAFAILFGVLAVLYFVLSHLWDLGKP